jgi:hypothetical protein
VVSLVCPCCSWLVLAPNVLQLCTNHFVWVVCRPVWVTKACQLFLVPSRSSNLPFYPSKGCELGSVLQLLFIPLLSTWAHIWVPWGVGSASVDTLPGNSKSTYHKLGTYLSYVPIYWVCILPTCMPRLLILLSGPWTYQSTSLPHLPWLLVWPTTYLHRDPST